MTTTTHSLPPSSLNTPKNGTPDSSSFANSTVFHPPNSLPETSSRIQNNGDILADIKISMSDNQPIRRNSNASRGAEDAEEDWKSTVEEFDADEPSQSDNEEFDQSTPLQNNAQPRIAPDERMPSKSSPRIETATPGVPPSSHPVQSASSMVDLRTNLGSVAGASSTSLLRQAAQSTSRTDTARLGSQQSSSSILGLQFQAGPYSTATSHPAPEPSSSSLSSHPSAVQDPSSSRGFRSRPTTPVPSVNIIPTSPLPASVTPRMATTSLDIPPSPTTPSYLSENTRRRDTLDSSPVPERRSTRLRPQEVRFSKQDRYFRY